MLLAITKETYKTTWYSHQLKRNFFSWNAYEKSIFGLAVYVCIHNRCQRNHFADANCQPFDKNASYNPALSTCTTSPLLLRGAYSTGIKDYIIEMHYIHQHTCYLWHSPESIELKEEEKKIDNRIMEQKSLLNCPTLFIFYTCLVCAKCQIWQGLTGCVSGTYGLKTRRVRTWYLPVTYWDQAKWLVTW